MNIKLHKNPLFDFFIFCIDLFICIASYFIVRLGLSFFFTDRPYGAKDIADIAVMTGIMLFMLYIYEFYTKFVRRKYEIILSVFLSVFAAAAVNVILNFCLWARRAAGTAHRCARAGCTVCTYVHRKSCFFYGL